MKMQIDSYQFGSMTIERRVYDQDLIIFPNRIMSDWWRKEGHSLSTDDLVDIIDAKPEILIVGTGAMGRMQIPLATRLALQEENIELIDKVTDHAVQYFNEQIQMGRNVIGAFHLTC